MMPLTTEVRDIAHQIPSSPSGVAASAIANGILDPVNTILMMLHSLVLPRPDSAPIVISSHAHKCFTDSNDQEITH